jgi:hypothetical protein
MKLWWLGGSWLDNNLLSAFDTTCTRVPACNTTGGAPDTAGEWSGRIAGDSDFCSSGLKGFFDMGGFRGFRACLRW